MIAHKKHHTISKTDRNQGWLIIATFAYIIFVAEWHYSYIGPPVPLLLNYKFAFIIRPMFLLLMLYVAFIRSGASSIKKIYKNIYAVLWIFFLIIVIAERLHYSRCNTPTNLYHYEALMEMPVWAILGFLFADTKEKAYWILYRIAVLCAISSLASYLLYINGIRALDSIFGAASFPTRLIFLFGFCWFFLNILLGRISILNLLGFAGCATEIIIVFHKPFVFSAAVAIFITTAIALFIRKEKKAILLWFFLLCFFGASFFAVHSYINEEGLNAYKKAFYQQYLHVQDESMVETGDLRALVARASGGRIELWQEQVPDIYSASPLIGSGLDQSLEMERGYVSMHNGYLDLLLAIGVSGTFVAGVALILWFYHVFKSFRKKDIFIVQLTCFGYVISVLAYNIGGTSRYFIMTTFFLFFIMGISFRTAVEVPRYSIERSKMLKAE